ncbi:Fatty acyl-CoA reductase [Cynara cardunculus var. scolymus]|uniref:Fatty acyl-CoA reductase n=1 Tax=Cynara cardunculus var. scolymus TaxID=59895 RepID=A0A103XHF9_CYNCS|nr:Fatty acyl-CoA reductase [Cynara cardunculus var. scolymus]
MVVNAMFVAMVAHINQPYSKIIYHLGSSMSNPITTSRFTNCISDYFTKHPLTNRQGNPIKNDNRVKLLSSKTNFYMYVAIPYMIPLKLHYNDTNLRKLLNMADLSEMDSFFFDSKLLNWEDYFTNIHVPGLMKYAIKSNI